MAELEQPKIDAQAALDELVHADPEVVESLGRKVRIGWLHKDTEDRISRLMLREGDGTEMKLVRWYSYIMLDRRSGLLTWLLGWSWHWLHWRWLWYVRRERGTAFQMDVVLASKKKIQERSRAFVMSTILMIEAMDTMMMRARHEAGRAGRHGEPATP